jgi:hypothetical protein
MRPLVLVVVFRARLQEDANLEALALLIAQAPGASHSGAYWTSPIRWRAYRKS